MRDFPANTARIRITTFDGEVTEFDVADNDSAFSYYEAMQSNWRSMPRMTLLDSSGQEIPTMSAPD
jgi:hypothetical protein